MGTRNLVESDPEQWLVVRTSAVFQEQLLYLGRKNVRNQQVEANHSICLLFFLCPFVA